MKATQFFSTLTRKEFTNLATEIANSKIQGMKVKASQFIDAIAKSNGKSSEAFLAQLDSPKGFEIHSLEAIFDHTSGSACLASISLKIKVDGFWIDDKISILEGTYDESGLYVKNPRVRFTGSDNAVDNNSNLSTTEINHNLRSAMNHAFFIADEIALYKKDIKNEKDLLKIINGSWKTSHFGLKKTS